MKKFLFSLICLFVLGSSLFGWDVYSGANDATKAVLAKVDALIEQEQYQSAFGATNGEGCQEEYLLAKRIEIATNYFAQSFNHNIFAFTNLKEGQTLYDVRTGGGNFSVMMVDPVTVAESYMAANGGKPVLYYALGAYYADVRGRYGDQLSFSFDELYEKEIENFGKAYDAGVYDAFSLSELGVSYAYLGDNDSAISIYEAKEKEYELTGDDDYNYGFCFLRKGQTEKGAYYLESSIDKYADNPQYQYDSYSLVVQVYIMTLKDFESAGKVLLNFKKDFPTDYRVTLFTILFYAAQNLNDQAIESSFELFAMAPTNPSACQLIMQQGQSAGNMEFLPGFFDQALVLYAENSGAVANLYFHYAYTLCLMQRNEEAWNMVLKAREAFTQNGTLTSDIEQSLDQIQNQIMLNAGAPFDAVRNMAQ